jgi:hypothetical protein
VACDKIASRSLIQMAFQTRTGFQWRNNWRATTLSMGKTAKIVPKQANAWAVLVAASCSKDLSYTRHWCLIMSTLKLKRLSSFILLHHVLWSPYLIMVQLATAMMETIHLRIIVAKIVHLYLVS